MTASQAGGDGGALAGKIGGDHAEVAAQLGQVPALAAEDAHPHPGREHGIDLAGHGHDERGLAAAVGAEDRDVLAGVDLQVDVVQHHPVAARYIDLAQLEKPAGLGRCSCVF